MTFKQLLEELQAMPEDRLEDTATIYEPYDGEYYAISGVGIAREEDNDQLDPGHFYMVLKA